MDTILNQICRNHGINEEFINAKKMDKENRIFISDSFVIKIYFPKKFHYYFNELEVYKNLSDKDYIPKLFFYGEELEYKYIVISRLKGKLLFDSWDDSKVIRRVEYIEQISEIIKNINLIRNEEVNFKSVLDSKFEKAISDLNYSKYFMSMVKEAYNDYSKYVSTSEMGSLVHVDVHFYNFFANEDKIYAYDFENMIVAPKDYQLLRWYRMWKYPETFIYPKDSLNQEQKDTYKILMPILLLNYQELFKHPNFEERMKTYLLVYLMEEAKRCKLPEETVKAYIKENQKIMVRGKL